MTRLRAVMLGLLVLIGCASSAQGQAARDRVESILSSGDVVARSSELRGLASQRGVAGEQARAALRTHLTRGVDLEPLSFHTALVALVTAEASRGASPDVVSRDLSDAISLGGDRARLALMAMSLAPMEARERLVPLLIERLIESNSPGDRLAYGDALRSTGTVGRAAVTQLAADPSITESTREFASYLLATWPPNRPGTR